MSGPVPFLAAGSVLRVFAPGSPQARAIFNLGVICAIIFAVIYIIVAGLIVFALMRFRWRDELPKHWMGLPSFPVPARDTEK